MRILRTSSSETMIDRGYPQTLIENLLSDIYKVHREEVSGNNVRGQYYYLYPVSAPVTAFSKRPNSFSKTLTSRTTVKYLLIYLCLNAAKGNEAKDEWSFLRMCEM